MEEVKTGSPQDLSPPGSLTEILAQGWDSPCEDDDFMPDGGQGAGHGGSKRSREGGDDSDREGLWVHRCLDLNSIKIARARIRAQVLRDRKSES